MSTNVNVQETWTVEPELMEKPPRRTVASDYPDLNKPNAMLFYGIGGAVVVGGLVLLIVGLAGKNTLLTLLGILLAIGGGGLLGYMPIRVQRHLARGQHLAENGMPVMARILSADNLTGDSTYGRSVRYQVTLPGGDIVHRDVNVDERILPKRIPANVTALMDMNSGDVELYCALPMKVISKDAPVTAPAAAQPVGAAAPVAAATAGDPLAHLPTAGAKPAANNGGGMGTIGTVPIRPATPENAPEKKPETPQPESKPTKSGLPWE